MFKESVCGVISAKGRTHGGNGDARLATVPDERNHFLAEVGIENGLNVTAMEGMSGFVVEAEPVDGIDAEKFHAAGVDEIGEGAHHALAFKFPFISGAGRKAHEWRPPVPVDDDAQFDAEARGMPAMVFASHARNPCELRESSMPAEAPREQRVCTSGRQVFAGGVSIR